ncbi:MAG: hypothetical protein ACD_60C00149G0006 [uncultured bacterium]|nr:MAG: hypothetical protein ACD_60C00149G0006 [uncultured bacterium]
MAGSRLKINIDQDQENESSILEVTEIDTECSSITTLYLSVSMDNISLPGSTSMTPSTSMDNLSNVSEESKNISQTGGMDNLSDANSSNQNNDFHLNVIQSMISDNKLDEMGIVFSLCIQKLFFQNKKEDRYGAVRKREELLDNIKNRINNYIIFYLKKSGEKILLNGAYYIFIRHLDEFLKNSYDAQSFKENYLICQLTFKINKSHISIQIEDDGNGFKENMLNQNPYQERNLNELIKLDERTMKSDKEHKDDVMGGHHLGLLQVRNHLNLFKGEVFIRNRPGKEKGACLRFTSPIDIEDLPIRNTDELTIFYGFQHFQENSRKYFIETSKFPAQKNKKSYQFFENSNTYLEHHPSETQEHQRYPSP